MRRWRRRFSRRGGGRRGGMMSLVIGALVVIIVLGALIPVLWPSFIGTLTDIAAVNGTDTGTVFMKAMWPIGVLLIAIGIGVALLFYALGRTGLLRRR
jgi:hypothetical protein